MEQLELVGSSGTLGQLTLYRVQPLSLGEPGHAPWNYSDTTIVMERKA